MTWEQIGKLENFIYFVVEMKYIIIIAFIIQLITNIILIFKIPKMLKYQRRIFQKLYNFELEHKIDMEIENIIEEKEQENIKNYFTSFKKKNILDNLEDYEKSDIQLDKEAIEYIILGILIMIIVILIFIKFK